MEKILNEIDKSLQATFKNKGLKAYGLCELVTKEKTVSPIHVKDRKVAQIDDRFDGIFFHRLLSSNDVDEDKDFSFGMNMSLRHSIRIRTFMAFKLKLGEDFIFEFVNAFPQKFFLEGFKFVHLSEGKTLIADHEAVYNQEYGSTSYERHRTPWNIFALEYDIEFMKC